MFKETTAIHKILKMNKRLRIVQGGSSAGKTIAILLVLIDKAQSDKHPTLTSVVSESFPHLKRGAMRDFLNIMDHQGYFQPDRWNKTDYQYTFETGSKIEFFSADQPGKVRGPRRDRLFENEANNIPFETHTQLAIRTNEDIYIDYNPVAQFWVHDEIIPNHDHDFLILTYKDNEALPETIVREIESRRARKSWFKVYGQGLLGEVEGKIYRDWDIIDEIPRHARIERRGLDFGYSNDPSALVAIYYYDQGYILDEELHGKGLPNKRIADTILNQEHQCLVIADSAEPKSIDEIKGYGVNIVGAEKGKDSVNNGIQLIQDQTISMTKRSINLIKEYRNYLWKTDKEGTILNVPEHEFSHSMDATRYGLVSLLKQPDFKMPTASEPVKGYYLDREMPF